MPRRIKLSQLDYFRAVGQFYREFGQTSDAEVQTLLAQAQRRHPTAA